MKHYAVRKFCGYDYKIVAYFLYYSDAEEYVLKEMSRECLYVDEIFNEIKVRQNYEIIETKLDIGE